MSRIERPHADLAFEIRRLDDSNRPMRVRSLSLFLLSLTCVERAQLPEFKFAADGRDWKAAHEIRNAEVTPEGLRFEIAGEDPYLVGPPRDYPAGIALRVTMRVYSEQGGVAQIFYFTDHPREPNSIHIPVPAGAWTEVKGNLPALGPGYRLRIDPPGAGGKCVIDSVRFAPLLILTPPAWPKPDEKFEETQALVIKSGDLRLVHGGRHMGAFGVQVSGNPTADGWNNSLIGYLEGDKPVWVRTDAATCRVTREGEAMVEDATLSDPGGASWHLRRTFMPGRQNCIDVVTSMSVSRERNVIFLPVFGLFPGAGSFGAHKTQAVFPGLEYLDRDEPSSSEADVVGLGSRRQVPDSLKITFPLMAVVADGRYVGMIWDEDPKFAAVFDSPDRMFQSGGHVMGLILPGSDGTNRIEGNLLPLEPRQLKANEPVTLRATLIGGLANDVTPAVRQYVSLRGLPPVRKPMDFHTYARLAAAGWLDSGIHDGPLYRHALPGAFGFHPAADAAMWQNWLSEQSSDGKLKVRLSEAAGAAIAQVAPDAYDFAAVSHITEPVPTLVYGHVAEAADAAERQGKDLLKRFEPDGSVWYRPDASGEDLGKTHAAPDANGLTSSLVLQVLRDAAFSGDPELIHDGVRLLRAMGKFAGTVPRGAQTWEVPLHTPDILASAHLVRAYTLGYQITGDAHFLDQAKYWAWTGVPFIYLVPTTQPVGPYAGIAVLGATHWTAPVWMGLPVQWCALVYADALYHLVPYDAAGPWGQLADGITASGLQQTWPVGSDATREGLLPDSFNLRAQSRNDAAINPGTLQADAIRLFGRAPVYEFHSFRDAGLLVHVPGRVLNSRQAADGITFEVSGWSSRPYFVLVCGLKSAPRVSIDGSPVRIGVPECGFIGPKGRLVLRLVGRQRIEIKY